MYRPGVRVTRGTRSGGDQIEACWARWPLRCSSLTKPDRVLRGEIAPAEVPQLTTARDTTALAVAPRLSCQHLKRPGRQMHERRLRGLGFVLDLGSAHCLERFGQLSLQCRDLCEVSSEVNAIVPDLRPVLEHLASSFAELGGSWRRNLGVVTARRRAPQLQEQTLCSGRGHEQHHTPAASSVSPARVKTRGLRSCAHQSICKAFKEKTLERGTLSIPPQASLWRTPGPGTEVGGGRGGVRRCRSKARSCATLSFASFMAWSPRSVKLRTRSVACRIGPTPRSTAARAASTTGPQQVGPRAPWHRRSSARGRSWVRLHCWKFIAPCVPSGDALTREQLDARHVTEQPNDSISNLGRLGTVAPALGEDRFLVEVIDHHLPDASVNTLRLAARGEKAGLGVASSPMTQAHAVGA